MNCEGITTLATEITKLFADFKSTFGDKKLVDTWKIKKEIDLKVEYLLEETDPDQVKKRDRIAKELGKSWLGKFHEGRAWGNWDNDGNYKMLVSDNGESIDPVVVKATEFKNGTSWVWETTAGGNPRWRLIDIKGKVISYSNYQELNIDSEEIYPAREQIGGQTWSLIKHDGKKLSVNKNEQFYFTTPFRCGRAWVQERQNDKFKLIDTEGNIKYEGHFRFVWPFSEGYSLVRLNEGEYPWKCIDIEGNELEDFSGRFSDREEVSSISEGIFKIDKGDPITSLFEYMRFDGTKIVSLTESGKNDERYLEASDFHDGLARVNAIKMTEESTIIRKFYINKSGENAFDQSFHKCTDFSEGAAAVMKTDWLRLPDGSDGGWIYIGTDGKPLFPGDGKDGAKHFSEANPFKDGVAKVKEVFDGPEYYINKKGKRVFG